MTRTVMLIILFALFALGGWWLWRELRIDRCSAGHGEWNQSAAVCDPLPN